MITYFKNFWKEDEGQDLIEYTLLLAFVALVAAGLFIQAGTVTAGIWGTANSMLTSANKAAS
jgi:Flp pilus assembly pilin Flp